MPSGRVLNSGGPPKIICDAMVPSPLEPEDDELDPHPLTPIVKAVATAASATSLVFMFSPGGCHLRCRVLHERVGQVASETSSSVSTAVRESGPRDARSWRRVRPVIPRETV